MIRRRTTVRMRRTMEAGLRLLSVRHRAVRSFLLITHFTSWLFHCVASPFPFFRLACASHAACEAGRELVPGGYPAAWADEM